MGRNKIKIETKKTSFERKVTYEKRRRGIMKKAQELSVMCDAPVVLLFFSPTNKNSYQIFVGAKCNLGEMIEKYASVPPQERFESKAEAFKELEKAFQKQGKIIDINYELMCHQRVKPELGDMQNRLFAVQAEIRDIEIALGPLSYLDDINSINDINLLEEMEKALKATLSYNSSLREYFLKHFRESFNIKQEIYPNQFHETPCIFQENYDHKQFIENPSALQVPHQLQNPIFPQVLNNLYYQSEVMRDAGPSCSNCEANMYLDASRSSNEEQLQWNGNAVMQDANMENKFLIGEHFCWFH